MTDFRSLARVNQPLDNKRVVALISGRGTNLQALLDAPKGWLGGRVEHVISNIPDVPGLERARAAGAETTVIPNRSFQSREAFDTELIKTVLATGPDLVILAGFMRILTPIFIEPLVGRILNIHPSLLPEFPGLNTHRRAIDAGRKVHGATVHFVTQELDGGPPVLQAQVAINRDDTERTLSARVLMREHEIFPLASRWFLHGRLRLEAGHPTLDGKTLLAPLDFDNVSTANR